MGPKQAAARSRERDRKPGRCAGQGTLPAGEVRYGIMWDGRSRVGGREWEGSRKNVSFKSLPRGCSYGGAWQMNERHNNCEQCKKNVCNFRTLPPPPPSPLFPVLPALAAPHGRRRCINSIIASHRQSYLSLIFSLGLGDFSFVFDISSRSPARRGRLPRLELQRLQLHRAL